MDISVILYRDQSFGNDLILWTSEEPVPMPIGLLGLGELSPVNDNLHGHGHIPIRHWAVTAGSVL